MESRLALAIGLSVILALSLVSGAWAQPNVTLDSPFQIRYFSNLNAADSFVNMTNTGARGVPGDLCVNTYVFSPDEQMEECCTCLISANGLKSYSVRNDLTANPLTPAVSNSVVVKLLASAPVGGSCNAAAPGALSSGLLAWATTNHVQTTTTTVPNSNFTCQAYCTNPDPYLTSWCQQNCPPETKTTTTTATTETPFAPATLSAGELARLTNLCTFIQANGSGFGICRSCQLGGK
jgi:hypothetical protein